MSARNLQNLRSDHVNMTTKRRFSAMHGNNSLKERMRGILQQSTNNGGNHVAFDVGLTH